MGYTKTTRGYPVPLGDQAVDIPADMLGMATAIDKDMATVAGNADAAMGRTAAVTVAGWTVYGSPVILTPITSSTYGAVWGGTLSRTGGSLSVSAGAFTTLGRVSGVTLPRNEGHGIANVDGTTYALILYASGDLKIYSPSARTIGNGTGVQLTCTWTT